MAGIEVILTSYSITQAKQTSGETISGAGLTTLLLYLTDPITAGYLIGLVNTPNCNHPVVRNQIVDCPRYQQTEMHVDGFRFDLASILGRGQDGTVLNSSLLLEQIAMDPVLAGTR